MQRNNIIILTDLYNMNNQETWGSLTELCKNHDDFSYYSLKAKKFPFEYKGYFFNKVPFRLRIK